MLHMGLDAGAHPDDVFYCKSLFAGTEASSLLERFCAAGASLTAVSEHVMQTLSQRDTPQGILATFGLLETSLEALQLTTDALVIILDRLQDPGNLGTLIRTADAVGAAAVVLIEPCVDPFDPKTVRGSMGSLFSLPVAQTSDVAALFAWLDDRGLQPVGADASRGTVWGRGHWNQPTALILGNEARGLSDDVRPHVRAWARLPIVGQAESLNVAVAGGVLMYAWLHENLRDHQETNP